MKKSILFWMSAMLMLSVGMVGCSNDEENIDETANISRGSNVMTMEEYKNVIIGKYQLQTYCTGWSPLTEAEPDELTLELDKDGMVTVNAKDDKFSFLFTTGTYRYTFKEVTPIKGKESMTILEIGESPNQSQYSFLYNDYNGDTMLRLWEYGVFDGLECNFKKVE